MLKPNLSKYALLVTLCWVPILTFARTVTFAMLMSPIVKKVKKLVQERDVQPNKPIPIVALAGAPAVGKTFLSKQLARLLESENIQAKILTQDDFLQNEKMHPYLIHPYLNYKKLQGVLSSVSGGKREIILPVKKPHQGEEIVDFSCIDVIIFEGVYSFCGPESFDFFKHCSFGIFVEGNEKDVSEWHWQRELQKPSDARRSKRKFHKDLACNMIDYHTHILPCRVRASFIIFKKTKDRYCLLPDSKLKI